MSLAGALLRAARKAAGRVVTRTKPSGLLSLAGVVSVALPAITAGMKKPLLTGADTAW